MANLVSITHQLRTAFTMLMSSVLVLLVLSISSQLNAATDNGKEAKYQVFLEDKKGNQIYIGDVHKVGAKLEFHRDDEKFKDFFLSMKEMKCLEGPEVFCHIPYPYPQENVTEDNNLLWLSHELFFMYKRSDQFGAKLRQGVFFALEETKDGITAKAYHLDLNDLASPPDTFAEPPIKLLDLVELETEYRWLPFLKIKPI